MGDGYIRGCLEFWKCREVDEECRVGSYLVNFVLDLFLNIDNCS